MQVYIGPGKYFVTSDVGRGRTQWYAFLALPPGSKSRASNKEYLRDLFMNQKEGRWSEEIFKVSPPYDCSVTLTFTRSKVTNPPFPPHQPCSD